MASARGCLPGGYLPRGGVSAQEGVPAQRGVSAWDWYRGGVYLVVSIQEGVPARRCLPRGGCLGR